MSLILDALNRSRRDAERVPGLASDHFVENAGPGMNWLPWLLVAALAGTVLVIGWLLFAGTPRPAPAIGSAAELTPAAEQAPPVRPQPTSAAAVPVRPEIASPSSIATDNPELPPAQPAVREAPPAQDVAAAAAAGQAADRASPAPGTREPDDREPVDAGVAALYRQRAEAVVVPQAETPAPEAIPPQPAPTSAEPQSGAVTTLGSSREEESLDIEQLVEKARVELENARLTEHEVPLLSTLSQQTKDSIPTLMYLRHDYSGEPSRSSVYINGKSLRVGGNVGGVKVREILPDSVVLEFNRTRFRLRALNSWVNL